MILFFTRMTWQCRTLSIGRKQQGEVGQSSCRKIDFHKINTEIKANSDFSN